jgi:2'-hydroxyisoflavone reductase
VQSLRLLILGGSGFIGPYHVRAALVRGHRVTVVNRGTRRDVLPAEAELLVADRDQGVDVLRGREWDAVIDLNTYGPRWVRELGEAVSSRTEQYVLMSTVAVYDTDVEGSPVDELSPVIAYREHLDPYALELTASRILETGTQPGLYGALKVLAEREAERQFPGRTLVVRSGAITGPEGAYLAPWFSRLENSDRMIAPGTPGAPVQFVDVRDLADGVIHLLEQRVTGPVNAVGPRGGLTMEGLLSAMRGLFRQPVEFVWADTPWLIQQGVSSSQLPFWIPDRTAAIAWGGSRVVAERAASLGVTFRPAADTLGDSAANYLTRTAAERAAIRASTLSREFEAELLRRHIVQRES